MGTYLGHEDEAQRAGGAEEDEDGDDEVGRVRLVRQHVGQRHPDDAHDDHVVHLQEGDVRWGDEGDEGEEGEEGEEGGEGEEGDELEE